MDEVYVYTGVHDDLWLMDSPRKEKRIQQFSLHLELLQEPFKYIRRATTTTKHLEEEMPYT